MAARLDAAARADLDAIIGALRQERQRQQGLSQRRLADLLGVAAGSLKDWEGRRDEPSMAHCVRWAAGLGWRLAVDDENEATAPCRPAGADWETAEIRRLAAALRAARKRRRIRQTDLASALGVARGTLVRWEGVTGPPPRPIGLARWARTVGCVLHLAPHRIHAAAGRNSPAPSRYPDTGRSRAPTDPPRGAR